MIKASEVAKLIAAQNPASLAAKRTFLLRIPLEIILLGVYLDRPAFSTSTYVCCVILPLCQPVDGVYFEDGSILGFTPTRLPTPSGSENWDFTKDDTIRNLEESINKLLPAWDRLSDADECIKHLVSLPKYQYKLHESIFGSLVCLSAYQRNYDRCLCFIEEFREFSRSDRGLRYSQTSLFQDKQNAIYTLEKCILSEDYDLLRESLNRWYQASVRKLGLTKYSKLRNGI